ncbi:MAG: methionine gamma-lyase [Halanaerobiales bacterium]
MTKKHNFETRTVHAGESHCKVTGALRTPIHQSSTFVFDNVEQGARRFAGEEEGYIYTRLGNPTQTDLENKMANLENGEAAIAVGSGMAAVSGVILGLLDAGDHLIASRTLYGCTHSFYSEMLPRWDIEVTFVDMTDLSNMEKAIKSNTKAIYTETPSNPTMAMVDLKKLADIGSKKGITTIVDNTFMSPYLQKPIDFGIDVVIHSATKYISGHGDTIAGIIVGPEELIEELRMTTIKDIGGIIAPFDSFLLLRGLKTLAIRMDRTCENAMEIARFLKSHPAVQKVNYPGLSEHPQYELAKKQMDDFGGLMSFRLTGGLEDGKKLMNSVELCTLAVSLGDVDTLIQHPASMTHSVIPKEERLEGGITDDLVRLSVGIENVEDIIDDLKQGLDELL